MREREIFSMIELKSSNFGKVIDLVMKVPFNNYFARIVIDGKVEGRVFVDNENSPESCLVVHKYGMALLCGRTDIDSFNRKLASFLKNDSVNHGSARWILTYPEPPWQNTLDEMLGDDLVVKYDVKENEIAEYKKNGKILQTLRANFKFDKTLYTSCRRLPDGFRIERINHDIYCRITGSVIPVHYWKSEDDFLSNGMGYSLISPENEVACTCFTSFIVGDKYELGIETSLKFRGMGYAVYSVCAMIDFCLANNFEPVWGCRKENLPSFKLAEKVGFTLQSYHPYYTLPVL